MTNPNVQARCEEAGEKARRVQRKLDTVEFRVEGDDVLILSGSYVGEYVRALWARGSTERDYIVKYIWFRNDENANRILNSLCCR